MLHMLLRMRGLPPKTHELADGILGAENDDTAREYFKSIRISSKFFSFNSPPPLCFGFKSSIFSGTT